MRPITSAHVVELAPAVGRILRIDLSGSNPPTNHTPVATGLAERSASR
jgi:hypothetical protein